MWTTEAVKEVINHACKVIGVTWVLAHLALALVAGFFGGKDDD